MRLVSFLHRGRSSYGQLLETSISDIGAIDGCRDLGEALAKDLPNLSSAIEVPLSEITLLPPIPYPSKIICVGVNYDEHRKEMGRTAHEHPVLFTRFANTLVAHQAPILRPPESSELDYEGELAVIIGRRGRRIPEARALDHVAGYSCFNDATLRDWQRHTHQFTPGKNFPATGGFGPALVTLDELRDASDLEISTRVDGELVQHARTRDMIFSVPALLAYISKVTELLPGDVIATGTPAGVGAKRNPPRFLQAGSIVEVQIESVGSLVNPITEEGA
ncbi:MAG: fumarylacetoacetate hydrolase family protein [Deltaproteobacteria bacterium]|nr:fumarylacetoacetate hydrolase family protein [Deltaproteobacteria bacterium]